MPSSQNLSRPLQLALFITGSLWLLAVYALSGNAAAAFAARYQVALLEPLLEQGMLVLLLFFGFSSIYRAITRSGNLLSVNALPQRTTALQEWTRGAAIGWALALATAVPLMVFGLMHPQFSSAPRLWLFTLVTLAVLLLSTLGTELAFRGFLFQTLEGVVGPTAATVLLAAAFAIMAAARPGSTALSIAAAFAASVFFTVARLRTGALWLGWGLHFAWDAVTVLLLGLPLAGDAGLSSVIVSGLSGPGWWTGGAYGPAAGLPALALVLAASALVYRATRDYAWQYTHEPIVAGGHAVTIAPPAAHTAMEQTAAPAPLVQILGTTSTDASTLPVIREHLSQAEERSNKPLA